MELATPAARNEAAVDAVLAPRGELESQALDIACAAPGEVADYGVALSGGGFRATLFHLGALRRLNELSLLGHVERFSGVSGGSLALALLAHAWPSLRFENAQASNFELYSERVWALAASRVDAWLIAAGLVPPIKAAHLLAAYLDRRFLHGLKLSELVDTPRFTFNAMHLATGVGWRFTKRYMGTYRLGLVCEPAVTVAAAAAASAAFPPFVGPYRLRVAPSSYIRTRGADLFDRDDLKRLVLLLDGGAYDNLAVEPLLRRCRTLLVSDAGGNLAVSGATTRFRLWTPQLRRVLDASVDQGRDLRRRALVAGARGESYRLALWRTTSDPDAFEVDKAVGVPEAWRDYLATLPTRMWPATEEDRQALVAWGYLAADVVVRAFVVKHAPPPSAIPFDVDFSRPPPALRRAAGASALRR